jgi:hypothetical protein
MSSSKRPSTSSLRRFITSRPYVPVAEIRRRFGLDEPDCICAIARDGRSAYVGLPEREALKIQDLWSRDEIGLELSVEVQAPVVVGIYPMRIARYLMDGNGNGFHGNGHHHAAGAPAPGNGQAPQHDHVSPQPPPVATAPVPGQTATPEP